MRKDMVNQVKGQNYLRVKQHFDDMVRFSRVEKMSTFTFYIHLQKRGTVRTQDYSYHPISNTPFTLGIALPRDYGRYRVKGETEVSLAKFNSKGFERIPIPILKLLNFSVSDLFTGDNWRLHPDWVYCEYNYAGTPTREFDSPEDNMKHFFVKMQQPDWNWGTPSVLPLPKCSGTQGFDPNCKFCK